MTVRIWTPPGRSWSSDDGGTLRPVVSQGCGLARPAELRHGEILGSRDGQHAAAVLP